MNRRDFLELATQLSVGAFALPHLGACAGPGLHEPIAPPRPDRPIVVIGAGMAGLAAARALSDRGWPVVVLEGRERLGGRTHTARLGPGVADLGAAWIHGATRNPFARYTDAMGWARTELDLNPDAVYDAVEGAYLTPAEALELLTHLEAFSTSAWALDVVQDPDASAAAFIEAFVASRGVEGRTADRLRFGCEVVLSSSSGPVDEISPYLLSRTPPGASGPDELLAGGFRTAVRALAEGLDVRLGTPVAAIRYDADAVEVDGGGETLRATHAIVTVPLGVLKAGALAFLPALPDPKRAAIERIGFGSFEKVVLAFDAPFWSNRYRNVMHRAGTGVDLRFPLFFDMSAAAGAPTLACLYSGAFAAAVQAELSDEAMVRECLSILAAHAAGPVPPPVASAVTRWTSDPFSLGSYSYKRVGMREEDVDELARPVGGRVLFAGEATDAADWATVTGAFRSGLREARRIDPSSTLPGQG